MNYNYSFMKYLYVTEEGCGFNMMDVQPIMREMYKMLWTRAPPSFRSLDMSRIKNLLVSKITRSYATWLFLMKIHRKNQVYNEIPTQKKNRKELHMLAIPFLRRWLTGYAKVLSRPRKCLKVDGQHFEHLL